MNVDITPVARWNSDSDNSRCWWFNHITVKKRPVGSFVLGNVYGISLPPSHGAIPKRALLRITEIRRTAISGVIVFFLDL